VYLPETRAPRSILLRPSSDRPADPKPPVPPTYAHVLPIPPTFSPWRPDFPVEYAIFQRLSTNNPETNGITQKNFSLRSDTPEPAAEQGAKRRKRTHEQASSLDGTCDISRMGPHPAFGWRSRSSWRFCVDSGETVE